MGWFSKDPEPKSSGKIPGSKPVASKQSAAKPEPSKKAPDKKTARESRGSYLDGVEPYRGAEYRSEPYSKWF